MSETKDSTCHTCGKSHHKRRSRCKAAMAEKPEASSAASAPALRPSQTMDRQTSHQKIQQPPSTTALMPPPSEQPPRPQQPTLVPNQPQSPVEAAVYHLSHPTRQVYPMSATTNVPQLTEERMPARVASQRLQHDASKQACIKEMGNSAAVTRLDVAMSRLRKIYFGILEEQLLNEALLAAGKDSEDLRTIARGGDCCCGDGSSPRVPFATHDLNPVRGKRACVHCGAPAGRHHRVTQTSASDRALLLDPQLLPRLMHAYERNHALIVQDLREALARVEEAAGVTFDNPHVVSPLVQRPKVPLPPPLPPPLPVRPDVCPKECSPSCCRPQPAHSPTAACAAAAAPATQKPPLASPPKDIAPRRPSSWWRKLLCISAEDDS